MVQESSRPTAETHPRRILVQASIVIPLICLVVARWMLHEEHRWTPTATRHKLPDGRYLAYHVRGDLSRNNIIFWGHGTLSCRLEAKDIPDGLLSELDVAIVVIDRPGYGQSDAHFNRSLLSFADDTVSVADALGVDRFFLVGVSGGGVYSLAAARKYPERVRGVLLLATVGSKELLPHEELAERNPEFLQGPALVRAMFNSQRLAPWYHWAVGTRLGSRLSFPLVQALVNRAPGLVSQVDRKCMYESGPHWFPDNHPESLLQQTGTAYWQDMALYITPWGFTGSDIDPRIAKATHIWHGDKDSLISWLNSEKIHEALPGSQLHILPGEGHLSFWTCNVDRLKKILQDFLQNPR